MRLFIDFSWLYIDTKKNPWFYKSLRIHYYNYFSKNFNSKVIFFNVRFLWNKPKIALRNSFLAFCYFYFYYYLWNECMTPYPQWKLLSRWFFGKTTVKILHNYASWGHKESNPESMLNQAFSPGGIL